MGFIEGSGSESLLRCIRCSADLPLDALFCGGCGVPRMVALGMDVVDPALARRVTQGPTASERFTSFIDGVGGIFRAIGRFFVTMARAIANGLSRALPAFRIIALVVILPSLWAVIQTFLYSSSDFEDQIERYTEALALRDTTQLESASSLFEVKAGSEVMPAYFQAAQDKKGIRWSSTYTRDDWAGSAVVTLKSTDSGSTFELEFRAERSRILGIFTKNNWYVENKATTLDIDATSGQLQYLAINGLRVAAPYSLRDFERPLTLLPGNYVISYRTTGSGAVRTRSIVIRPGIELKVRI